MMSGDFLSVWPDTWRDIWVKLARNPAAPEDMFCELYRELTTYFHSEPDESLLVEILAVPDKAKTAFRKTKAHMFKGERSLIKFLEEAHGIIDDLGGDTLANRYFILVETFLDKFNLRYDLRRPFTLHPTLPGVFTKLIQELKTLSMQDAHLDRVMKDFEEAVRDLRADSSSNRIKTCIQKQVNLLEAIGQVCPGVTHRTLGGICDQVGTWPHGRIKEAMKNIYGFASDYPGIRHGGNPANAIRDIEMRDMVAVSILLAGFTPYLSDNLDSTRVYSGE